MSDYTPEQLAEIRRAVWDMSLATADAAAIRDTELHADRVVWWLENRNNLHADAEGED